MKKMEKSKSIKDKNYLGLHEFKVFIDLSQTKMSLLALEQDILQFHPF